MSFHPLQCLLLALATVPLASSAPAGPGNLAERLGYPPNAKLLIVHGDDIGVAHSVDQASIAAMEKGMVSSGSVMVPCPWFPEIAAYAREHPGVDLGLHLTLTSEWKVYRWDGVVGAEGAPTLHDDQGFLYADTPSVARKADLAEVEREIRAQVDRAIAFGLHPTHLDSHMGSLFSRPDLLNLYMKVGRDYGIPVLLPRDAFQAQAPELLANLPDGTVLIDHLLIATPEVAAKDWDDFYANAIRNLEPGVTEIIVHLGYDDPELRSVAIDHPDYGSAWRQRDYDFFTSDRCAKLLADHDVHLLTWREIGRLLKK